jgi:hypothetical protein
MLWMAKFAIAPAMATVETWSPSRRMQAAAAAERERVERELVRLGARERELAAELARVQDARAELEHHRHALNQFTDEDALARTAGKADRRLRALADVSSSPVAGATVLRGALIRETAVRVLAASSPPDAPVHYRDWFQLLIAQGYVPAGKDSLATFLTQIGRSPVVQRTTTAGMYALDPEFPRRARKRLSQLADALNEVQELTPTAGVEDMAGARERRNRLTVEIRETERQLEEAVRSLTQALV